MKENTSWSVAKHDTIPAVDLNLIPLEGHAYLSAFLAASGEEFTPPYSAVRNRLTQIIDDAQARERRKQPPSDAVSPQRLRTWRAVFESFGLITVDSETNRLGLTALGRKIQSLYAELNRRIEGANDQLASVAIYALNRHLLRNPLDQSTYPEDCDVHPYRFIWRTMRKLDDKLHWEELNRVIMKVNYQREEEAAISNIREVRRQASGIYTEKNVGLLGAPAIDDGAETKRRLTPWFTQAGFGGLLISAADDAQGYRHLTEKFKSLIDATLETDVVVPATARTSAEAYLHYLTESPTPLKAAGPYPDDTEVTRVSEALRRYGPTKIVCLAGIPATGKSRLAKLAASRIVDGDPYRLCEIQFHESTAYEDFIEGFVPRPDGQGFELVRKTFRLINRRAKLDPKGAPYVLLIEEFTRANVHSVLGELITYIEHRDRPFRFSLSQEEETVAPNLLILATMNPRDKSAMVLDHAILRRMHQIYLPPSTEQLRTMLDTKMDAALIDRLAGWFQKHIGILPFGHGSFAGAKSAEDLHDIWAGTLRYFLLDTDGTVNDSYRDLEKEYPWR